MKALIIVLAILCSLGLFVGYAFRVMHWPYGFNIFYGSIGGLVLSIVLAVRHKK